MDVSATVQDAATAFPGRLKEILKYRKMSQRELAIAVGATESNVSSWTTGRYFPNTPALIGIAEATHTTLDWLTGRTDATWDVTDSTAAAKYLCCSEPVATRLHVIGVTEKKHVGSSSLDILVSSPLWVKFVSAVQKYVSDSTKKPTDIFKDAELGTRYFEDIAFYSGRGFDIVPTDGEKSLQEATKLLTQILETAAQQAQEASNSTSQSQGTPLSVGTGVATVSACTTTE